MKNISNHIGKLLLGIALPLGASAGVFSSCNDFLDLKPLSQVVLENYWTEKADVESAVFGCYSGLAEPELMKRIYAWGDLRSDDILYSKSGNDINVQQIIEENILETNPMLNWESLYQVINRCNTVIYYAPSVAEIDPNYTESDLKANIAEVTWLRSLCYFYLLRTFRDVPYVTEPSMNDDDVEAYRIKPMPFADLLKQLQTDLEAVMNDALRFYPPFSNSDLRADNEYNSSRATQCAFHALLADIALWRNDYQKCLEHTQWVLDFKKALYQETIEEATSYTTYMRLFKDKYPLYLETPVGKTIAGAAYEYIFGRGNSFESVFEIYLSDRTDRFNPIVSTYFGNEKSSVALCTAYADLATNAFKENGKYFQFSDCRLCEYFEQPIPETSIPIRKGYYVYSEFTPLKQAGSAPKVTQAMTSSPLNWVIYRMSDIMLMRAEALVELNGEENLAEAFELVSTIYNRANNILTDNSSYGLQADKYREQSAMRQLVRDERHRELMFEGKRWFDLVRYALRAGNNEELINTVLPKQIKNINRIRVQLKQPGALFWPYLEREVEINTYLNQNPAYIKNETSKK